jgi:hypothetical protein
VNDSFDLCDERKRAEGFRVHSHHFEHVVGAGGDAIASPLAACGIDHRSNPILRAAMGAHRRPTAGRS